MTHERQGRYGAASAMSALRGQTGGRHRGTSERRWLGTHLPRLRRDARVEVEDEMTELDRLRAVEKAALELREGHGLDDNPIWCLSHIRALYDALEEKSDG